MGALVTMVLTFLAALIAMSVYDIAKHHGMVPQDDIWPTLLLGFCILGQWISE